MDDKIGPVIQNFLKRTMGDDCKVENVKTGDKTIWTYCKIHVQRSRIYKERK